jgi:hypothetical protein
LIVLSDNVRRHIPSLTLEFLEQNSVKRAPHPPYSPDLAPSDFYLFGYVKQCLSSCAFAHVARCFTL